MNKLEKIRVLWLEDQLQELFVEILKISEWADRLDIEWVENGDKAWHLLVSKTPDIFITDIKHPGYSGDQLINMMAEKHIKIPTLIFWSFEGLKEVERWWTKEYPDMKIIVMSKGSSTENFSSELFNALAKLYQAAIELNGLKTDKISVVNNQISLISFALKEEAAPFRKIAAGLASPPDILLVGIGRQNAEKSVRAFLATHSPQQVFTCGFAGGLHPELKLGDVVFELSTPNSQLSTQLTAAGAKPASIFCADRIATTVAEKRALREQTKADAVEMESGAIQAVCRERGIPCVTLRVISDTAHEDLPLDFNALAKPDKNLDFGKLAWAIAKSPGKIGALLQLQKKTSFAAQQLAAVLAKIIS